MSAPPVTPNLIQSLMQIVTMNILGLDPSAAASAQTVRVGWQAQGQPAQQITEDIIYIRCVEEDDEYNRIRDLEIADVLPEPATLVQLTSIYTRVWRTFWTIYGPSSFDNARAIRSALLTQNVHDMFLGAYNTYGQIPSGEGGFGGGTVNIYLVTDMAAPRRVPELFDGQWWERVDFDCQFNEQVNETTTVNAVESTEVILETNTGVVRDTTISSS